MRAIPTNTPCNVAALYSKDPNCGEATHRYGIQFGGLKDIFCPDDAWRQGPSQVSNILRVETSYRPWRDS